MAATPDKGLRAALLSAREAGAILAALAAVEYRRTHPGDDCPPDAIPTETAVCEWWPSCPDTAAGEAAALAASLPLLSMVAAVRGGPAPRLAAALPWRWEAWPDADARAAILRDARDGNAAAETIATLENGVRPRLLLTAADAPASEISAVHEFWQLAPPDPANGRRPRHPLAPVVAAWQARPCPACDRTHCR